jgi:hypothetical protein
VANPYAPKIVLAMAPGHKKAFVLKQIASLFATGTKRVAEKFSPWKNK